MTAILAEPELTASPIAAMLSDLTSTTLGGQHYLLITLDDDLLSSALPVLSRLGASSEIYEYFEQIATTHGPLLRPIDSQFSPFVPLEMAETRRYKGKTNEIFTRVLLNVALFAGSYATHMTQRLRILDPLAGGATTLFLALANGYDAFGIERERQDIETTAVFVRQYLKGEQIRYKEVDEHSRKAGRRHQFEIGPKEASRQLVLAQGNAQDATLHMREVVGGPRMHAIVADLPYGIQHFGEIADLLGNALPIWQQMLLPGGTIALAWNATRIERVSMIELIERSTQLHVRNEPPYTLFAHAVDRVIKRRDIVVAG